MYVPRDHSPQVCPLNKCGPFLSHTLLAAQAGRGEEEAKLKEEVMREEEGAIGKAQARPPGIHIKFNPPLPLYYVGVYLNRCVYMDD